MESSYKAYDFEKSRARIDEILGSTDNNYEEVNQIPSRDKLTFTNGFYANCTALFVDIRKSSELPGKHKRPTLAKIYRSYISEVVAVINSNSDCVEVNIHGDAVWGIFNTPYQRDIQEIFHTSATISSLIDVLNCKFKKRNIDPITIGIGMDYGRALMIKAGYNGSGINDVVWMGEVVNKASKLCGYGNKSAFDNEIMVTSTIYSNLEEDLQKYLSWNSARECYHGNVIRTDMQEWIDKNCQ